MLLCFSFLIISMRLLLPGNQILSVFIAIFILFFIIDIPFIIVDGWIGRYTPAEKKMDEEMKTMQEGTQKEGTSILQKKKQRLKIVTKIIDILYLLLALLAIVCWTVTDYLTIGITRRVYIIGTLYLSSIVIAITYLRIKNPRNIKCCTMPYFLGPFVVRCIRYYYKKSGKYEKFGNGNAFHNYIGS